MGKSKCKLSRELRKLIGLIVLEACVFGVAYWIVARFFPAEVDIYNAILISSIFAVGITIMLRGNATRNRNLNVAGFIVFLFAVFVVIYRYEEFAVKISAFAALLVAFAAFASIEESRRIRRDSVEREGRDRKERLVDEVARWLRELAVHIFPARGRLMSQISQIEDRLKGSEDLGFEQWLDLGEIELDIVGINNLIKAMKEADYYQKLTLQLDEELSRLIEVILNEIKERLGLLSEDIACRRGRIKKCKGGKSAGELPKDDNRKSKRSGSSVGDIISKKIEGNAGAIEKSIQKAIEKAIELKVSLI